MVVPVNVLLVVAAVIVFVLAAMWLVVGTLGITGRLRRNRWLGVRSPETLRSEQTFAVANRVAAPGELAAAGILVLAGILTLGVGGYWSLVFAVVGLVAAMFVVGIVSAYGVRAAAAVPADTGCACCSSQDATSTEQADQPPHDHDPADPASECGTSSCGACSLRGVCADESSRN
ncbi:SdpI family protein [Gordonia sp. PKS22-38]|uniref:SdpI family protein n=1 Tax=Gordonia prachuapensis TaxID=3115651 RepID=A0ABU7MZY5_9ACTN|nr:SdpI family protein [Gordonia sp. PKS22-38]